METFLNCNVVGIYGSNGHGIDVVAVGESIVAKVMADGC